MNRENEIVNIRIDEIIPNRFQPRLAFNEEELKELSESIKLHGIIQPLVLRRIGDKFEIIAGERRYKASVMAGLQTVPAIIMNLDDKKSAEVAVAENLQRKNLTAMEEAESFKKMLDMGQTLDELANKMGISPTVISSKLKLLELTDLAKQALLKNQISERHARSLLAIANPNIQISMLNRIIGERLTVKQTDEEISKILGHNPETINQANNIEPTPFSIPRVEPLYNEPTTPPTPQVNNISSYTNIPEPPLSAFDVDINKIKQESTDIIPEHKPSDIDMLMRTEAQSNSSESSLEKPKKISLEDTPTNVDMGSIISENSMAINPFQEVSSPQPLEIPPVSYNTTVSPALQDTNSSYQNTGAGIIEEFKQLQPHNIEPQNYNSTKSISSAINLARAEARKIEDLGFNIEIEEFDFEDNYQITIKILKD